VNLLSNNFTEYLLLIRCSENRSLIFVTRRRNTHYQRYNLHITGVNALKS